MTISDLTEFYRSKRVVEFKMGGKAAGIDAVYRLAQDYDSEESQEDLLADFFLKVPSESIEALVIGAWSNAAENGPDGFLDGLIANKDRLGKLRALFVGDMTFEECEISWIIQSDYKPLLDAFPQLESLRVRGSTSLKFSPFEHSNLQELAIECGGLPSAVANDVADSKMPALRSLELWLGDDNYGFDGDVDTYRAVLAKIRPERLRYLGLRDSMISEQLAQWVAGEAWLGSLHTLDLSLGTIGDIGAKALFESANLGNLERLDLSHHYISEAWQQKLRTLSCTVVLEDPQKDEGEGERYVAVAE